MSFSFDNSDPLYEEHSASGTTSQRKWEVAEVNEIRRFAGLTREEIVALKARVGAVEATDPVPGPAGADGPPGPEGPAGAPGEVVAGPVYADTTAALAAVAEGDYFNVPSDVAGESTVLYRKVEGAAVEVKRLPGAAILDAVPARSEALGEDVELLLDQAGSIVRRTDAAGRQFLPGMDRSVQEEAESARRRAGYGSSARTRDALQIEDASGNVILRQDEHGGLYIPGVAGSVQSALGQPLARTPYFPSDREKLHDLVKPLVADLIAEQRPFIPPPSLLVPNRYTVPDAIVSAFTCSQTSEIRLDTPYGVGGLVHPYLLEMRRPLLGYRYLLGETPHRNGSATEENPILYGSNDLENFHLIGDVPQPLGPPIELLGGDYNSDDALAYDPTTGELIVIWRPVGLPEGNGYYSRSTWNGVDWTDAVLTVPGTTGTLSPSLLYDPAQGIWHYWTVTPAFDFLHHTGPTKYGPWTQVGNYVTSQNDGFSLWHAEVKYLGDKFFCLAVDDGEDSNLYLGVSANGHDWTFGPGLVSPQAPYVYKASFVPEFNGNLMRLRLVWNTYAFPIPEGMTDSFHSEATNWVDLTTL